MAYIGSQPGVSSQRLETAYYATSGQTTFIAPAGYVPGNIDVFLNGTKLLNGVDFTASNGIAIVLTEAAALNDEVVLLAYIPRGLSDGYTKSEADTRYVLNTAGVINIGSGQIVKDSVGNLGLGVTPSGWTGGFKAFQANYGSFASFLNGGNIQTGVFANVYFDGSNYRYISSNVAIYYNQNNGSHQWFTATSGTAGNVISFGDPKMTLDNGGRLELSTGEARLDLKATNASGRIFSLYSGGGGNIGAGAFAITEGGATQRFVIIGGGTGESVRITAPGNFGIGSTNPIRRLVVSNGGNEGLEIGPGNTSGDASGAVSSIYYNRAASAYVSNIQDASAHLLRINGTTRVFVDSSGRFMVGGTTVLNGFGNEDVTEFMSFGSGGYCAINSAGANAPLYVSLSSSATASSLIQFSDTGVGVGFISTNGTSTTYGTTSDYRLKTNIQPMTGALAFVRQQRPVTYEWISNGLPARGYIAHWLQEDGAGDCVAGEKDAVDKNNNPIYQGVDASFMVAPLNAALNELADMFDQLKAEFDAYKAAHA